MYTASRIVSFVLVLCCLSIFSFGQSPQIVLGNGSPLPRYFCWDSTNYEITVSAGNKDGSFDGCGAFQKNGKWYFNPVVASVGVTVFPMSCNLSYTPPGGNKISRNITIAKPVVIHPPLVDTFTCNGHFSLIATTLYAGAYEYKWTPAAPLDRADTSVTDGYITTTTTFVITATDQQFASQDFFCSGSDTIVVVKHPEPELIVSGDTIINARDKAQLRASGALLYQWFPSQWLDNNMIPNPTTRPQAPIRYSVVGTNEFGCKDTAEIFVDLYEDLFVPNAFSPNDDGLNDVFRIENIGYQGVAEFRVFNRNGQEVFYTQDGTKGWDGTFNDNPAEGGTYFYVIRLVMRDGSIKVFKGDVTLLR